MDGQQHWLPMIGGEIRDAFKAWWRKWRGHIFAGAAGFALGAWWL